MTVIQDGNTLWVTKINLLEIIERNNMCNVKVYTPVYDNNCAVLNIGEGYDNLCKFPKEQLDDVITALQAYKAALPKPCVHAELIKRYAEDCQKWEKPWELWEWKSLGDVQWYILNHHPNWKNNVSYRRKLGAPL